MLQVTKTYLPSKKKFLEYIDQIWESHTLSNNGPLVQKLEIQLKDFSGCSHVLACTNGTIVLQMALRALNITKEVITTPFSYVATTNAILWEKCKPVFVDVKKPFLTIDANKIEAAITKNTQAIIATHVYGYPCDVEKIEKIAQKYKLKVIYDGAHAFGATYKSRSLLSFGDITTCSFHATKLFHCGEGGALFFNNENYLNPLSLMRSFGHFNDDYYSVGTNAKMFLKLKAISLIYTENLANNSKIFSSIAPPSGSNYSYYPVLFKNEKFLLKAITLLKENNIFPRRYFYPSLNKLSFLQNYFSCPISEKASKSVLCLPMSQYITTKEIKTICSLLNQIK